MESNGRIRYIGKTIDSLSRRFQGHLINARSGKRNHRCNWMRSLLKQGITPSIIQIGEVEGDGCREEIAWIKYFRDEGVDLVNATDGGEGTLGFSPSIKTRKKMSLTRKRQLRSLKLRKKIGKASRKWQAINGGTRKGSHPSLATRLKMSDGHKRWLKAHGGHIPIETRRKMKKGIKKMLAKLGGHLPEERQKQIKETTKNWWAEHGGHHSLKTRDKMSNSRNKWIAKHGGHLSKKTCKRMQEACIKKWAAQGGHLPEVTCGKIRNTLKEWYKNHTNPFKGRHHSEKALKKMGAASKEAWRIRKLKSAEAAHG